MSQLFHLGDLQFSLSSDNLLRSDDGNGKVYKGTFKDESVAVKKLSLNCPDISQDEQQWENLTKLQNEHLVKYHQCMVQNNFRFLVMELCQGSMLDYCNKTLDKDVASRIKATDIMWKIINAIDYLDGQKINHGDLKLENILFWKRDSKSRRVLVKLTAYGYSSTNTTDGQNQNNTNTSRFQLGCLFYSAATKNQEQPNEPVPPESLTEIEDDDHKVLASKLIRILNSLEYSNRLQIGTLLMHPFFTQCSRDAQSRLMNDEISLLWKDKQKLLLWEKYLGLNKSKFPDENFDDFKDILLLETMDTPKIVNEVFETAPNFFSEYIWHIANGPNKGNNKIPSGPSIELQEELGNGSFGKVYKCEYTDEKGNQYLAACKKSKSTTEAEELFNKEMLAVRKLDHLFVVKYLDIIEKDSKRYIVMELCEGSLKDYVEGKLERIPKDSLDDKILIGQVALGLAYIHDKGVIHKDLKLENILLKHQSPRLVLAKIADFGFAKELKPGKSEFSETEHPGSANYMAPELLNAPDGAYPASFASDVYAFGITIARIVKKGEHPFSSNQILRRWSMVNGEVPSNLQGLCWELKDLIPKLTDNDPGKRPEMVRVLRHPYFALTNDRTKRHFAEQLWTDFSSILSEAVRRKVIKNIFSCQNFRNWYENFSKDKPDTDEEIANKIGNNFRLFRELKPEIKTVSLNPASPAKEYKKTVKEAITSEYDMTIGYKINEFSGPKTNQYFPATSFSKYRLYKLIERAPKILVSYFWFSLPDVSRFQSSSPELESEITEIIPELQWSSLYYEEKELIDELWKIKYLEHKNQKYSQDTTREMIRIIGKCNVTEITWSSLLDWIEKHSVREEDQYLLLLNAVQSYASNIPKVTEMILRKYGTQMWSMELFSHMSAAANNEGNWAAEIMQVLLKYSSYYRECGFYSVESTSLPHAVQNESESGPKIVKLLLEKSIDPNVRYFYEQDGQFTLVHLAASNQGDYAADILKQLLEKGGNCDVCSTIGLFEPIHLATMNNGGSALKLFDLLLKKRGMNVIHEESGTSLIHFAMMNYGDCGPEILKKLLENGAEVNAIDNNKQTALHLTAKDSLYETNQDISLMKILLENGGDPNAADQHGRTPVHFAAGSLSGEHAHEKFQLLLDHGGKLTSKDSNGFNPVHYTLLNMGIVGAKMRELIGVNRESANVPLNSDSRTTLLHLIASQKKFQIPILSDPSKYVRKVDLVQLILDNGGNPDAKDEDGHSPVHIAVFLDGSYDGLIILQMLLKKGGDPNLFDIKQFTPVHYVAESASEAAPEQMKILLENGGSADENGGKQGFTPLHLAAMNSGTHGLELMEILLKYKGNPNDMDIHGRSPVHYAIIYNQSSMLKLLLKKGGDPNLIDNIEQHTPVHYAAKSASETAPEQMKILLENGGDANISGGQQGLTPLQLAIVNSGIHGLKLTEILLEHGGNPITVENLGYSSVHIAVFLKESSVVLSILQLLLKKGGDPNLIDNKEQYGPVHYAARSASEAAPEKMKFLLENGGDANINGGKQEPVTPLHLAAMNSGIHGHTLTTLLLEYGGNPNITDLHKRTSLHLAIQNENDQLRLDIIKQLLEKGGNANAGDKEGLTPVHYIIIDKRSNSLEVLKLLLKHGGNILQENHQGLTPHRLATQRGNKEYCLPEVKKHIERTYRKMK